MSLEQPVTYRPLSRALHWTVAVLVIVQVTMGFIMVYDGPEPNFWANLSNALQLYTTHKVLGLVILAFVLLRLANRVLGGTPPDADIATVEREASNLVHAWMYFLLLVVPLLGWIGISLYPALEAFGFNIPALTAPNRTASEAVFAAHRIAAFALIGLILLHVAGALVHHFVHRDDVLGRMLPSVRRRK